MKTIKIKNCKECPGCVFSEDTALCYPYHLINGGDDHLLLDPELLDDYADECPLVNGIVFKIDESNEFDDIEDLENIDIIE